LATQLSNADAVLISETDAPGPFVGGTFTLGPGPFTKLDFSADDDETDFTSFSTQSGERTGAGRQTGELTDNTGGTFDSGLVSLTQVITITDPVTGDEILVGRVSMSVDDGTASSPETSVFYIFSAPIDPNTTYDVTAIAFSPGAGPASSYEYSDFSGSTVPCFAPGTWIDTPNGARLVEHLKVGDLVWTLDHGPQAVRWIHSSDHPLEDCDLDAKPVLVSAGALGSGVPAQDLTVSPQHRMLVGGRGQLDHWFTGEALAAAKSLTQLRGVRHMNGKKRIRWIHFACDRHEVVRANGCLTETLLLGSMVMTRLPQAQKHRLNTIYGADLLSVYGCETQQDDPLNGPACRPVLKVGQVRQHMSKHVKNSRSAQAPAQPVKTQSARDPNLRYRTPVSPYRFHHMAAPFAKTRPPVLAQDPPHAIAAPADPLRAVAHANQ